MLNLMDESEMESVLKKWTFYVVQNPDLQFDYTLATGIKLMGGTLVSECRPDTIVITSFLDKFNMQVLETLPRHGEIIKSSDFLVTIMNITNGSKMELPTKPKRKKRTDAEKDENAELQKRLFATVLKEAQRRPPNLMQLIRRAKVAFPTYKEYAEKVKQTQIKNLVYSVWSEITRSDFKKLFETLDKSIKLVNQLTDDDMTYVANLLFKKR